MEEIAEQKKTWEILWYLNKAVRELNRCLIMAREAKVKVTVTTTVAVIEQNGKQIEFPQVETQVNTRYVTNDKVIDNYPQSG